ncbi:hypothetical protein [Cupriavidus basilensis]
MFDNFFIRLLPRLVGRKEGGLFTLATGYSPRAGASATFGPLYRAANFHPAGCAGVALAKAAFHDALSLVCRRPQGR